MWNCEYCNAKLVMDDFFKSWFKKCDHSHLTSFQGKYICNQCGYESINGTRTWYMKDSCKICDSYDEKKKNKGFKPKSGKISFYVHNFECSGHWYESDCCDCTCLDCNLKECCCYGFSHCCCEYECNLYDVPDMISNGINYQDEYGRTPLMNSVRFNDKKLVEMLLKSGSNIYISDKMGDTALTIAIKNGYKEMAKLMACVIIQSIYRGRTNKSGSGPLANVEEEYKKSNNILKEWLEEENIGFFYPPSKYLRLRFNLENI